MLNQENGLGWMILMSLLVLVIFPANFYGMDLSDSNIKNGQLSTACGDGVFNFDNWDLRGGSYNKEDGWLFVRSENTNPIALLKKRHDGDCTFSVTLRSTKDFHWAGLQAKGIYRLVVNNQFGRLELNRIIDGKWRRVAQLENYKLFIRNRNLFELKISLYGKTVYAFLDGKLHIKYEDNSPIKPGGYFGLMSGWKSEIAWGSISLSQLDAQSIHFQEKQKNRISDGLIEVTKTGGMRDDNIYFDNELPGIEFKIKTDKKDLEEVAIKLVLIDVRENQVAQKEIHLKLKEGEESRITVRFSSPGRGSFKIALFAGRNLEELTWIEDVGGFTVLPRLEKLSSDPASYFGGHTDGVNANWHIQAAKKLGIAWLRSHDGLQTGWWTRIQPESPDQWLWPYDNTQQLIDSQKMSTLGEILWTPKWASQASSGKHKPETAPPKNWSDFERFVTVLIKHYQNSIRHWEIWNEPHHNGYWQGSPEDYALLLEKSYMTIHKSSNMFTVIGGGGVPARKLDWIERLLQAGGAKYMNSFSIHYLDPNTATTDMLHLRSLLNKYGFIGSIWNTEESVPSTSFFDQIRVGYKDPEARYHFRNACFELVRIYMENISNGVERVFYYQQMDPWRFQEYAKPRNTEIEIQGGMWDEGRTLKPIAAAHAALVFALQSRRYMTRIDSGELRVFIFEGPDGATAVQYAEFPSYKAEERIALQLPTSEKSSNYKIFDFMGNEVEPLFLKDHLNLAVGREPRYLIKSGPKAGKVLKELYANAFLKRKKAIAH
ncbi:MAG: hypothetical protein KDI35_00390 [Gammaproteobacteria bacterium]|nr:hypothetical protein [Gammaproteobacteria bacterium]